MPAFDIDLNYGVKGETFVAQVFGLDANLVEVKSDARYKETGNVYVETHCKKQGGWADSGINVTEAHVWVFVLGMNTGLVAVKTDTLRAALPLGRYVGCYKGSHPTKGVIINLEQLLRFAAVNERQ
jgi:hypothetical protein